MKTHKYTYNDWFHYKNGGKRHGFYNDGNIYFGYYYQNKDKGFWLEKFTR